MLPPCYEPIKSFAGFKPADIKSIISRFGGQVEEIWIDTTVDHIGDGPAIQCLKPGSDKLAHSQNALVALHRLTHQESPYHEIWPVRCRIVHEGEHIKRHMLVTVNERVRFIRKRKNNILVEACGGPTPFRNRDYWELSKTWIGSLRHVFTRIERDLMPGCESPAYFKHRSFTASCRVEARMGYSNFHMGSLPLE